MWERKNFLIESEGRVVVPSLRKLASQVGPDWLQKELSLPKTGQLVYLLKNCIWDLAAEYKNENSRNLWPGQNATVLWL